MGTLKSSGGGDGGGGGGDSSAGLQRRRANAHERHHTLGSHSEAPSSTIFCLKWAAEEIIFPSLFCLRRGISPPLIFVFFFFLLSSQRKLRSAETAATTVKPPPTPFFFFFLKTLSFTDLDRKKFNEFSPGKSHISVLETSDLKHFQASFQLQSKQEVTAGGRP